MLFSYKIISRGVSAGLPRWLFQDNSAAKKLREVLRILCVHLPCIAVLSPATSQTEVVGIPGPFLPAPFSEAMPSYKAHPKGLQCFMG